MLRRSDDVACTAVPLVSVCPPVYNDAATVGETISSLLHQPYLSTESDFLREDPGAGEGFALDEWIDDYGRGIGGSRLPPELAGSWLYNFHEVFEYIAYAWLLSAAIGLGIAPALAPALKIVLVARSSY